jgi:hypothetical protein
MRTELTNTSTIQVETPAKILLTPAMLAGVREGNDNTSQWQGFKYG